MCYERTKIKICHKCFSTFLIPSASFLQPSWISTVTFHLHINSRVFPFTHYRPVQDEYHVSLVCMAGPNCLWVTTLRQRHITYITYMTPIQCRIMYSYYTTPSSVCCSDSPFNDNWIKKHIYQQLLIFTHFPPVAWGFSIQPTFALVRVVRGD